MKPIVLVRGGGDIATGVAARLHRSGFGVVVCEVERPLAVRRLVALAEAVYRGEVQIEELCGRRLEPSQVSEALERGEIPVLIDPQAESRQALGPIALVDGRMTKREPDLGMQSAPMVVGLGPGFVAGLNCHAVVETNRGHRMGRVYWQGSAQPDTGIPDPVAGRDVDRVLRAPAAGVLQAEAELGSIVGAGQLVARVGRAELRAPFQGALRGILHDGLSVQAGVKVGDLDPRCDPEACRQISDKSLAVGGGALEALLSRPEIRRELAASS